MAPEASADRFDFWIEPKDAPGSILSASLAGRNLHLVILARGQDPAAGSPLFNWPNRCILHARSCIVKRRPDGVGPSPGPTATWHRGSASSANGNHIRVPGGFCQRRRAKAEIKYPACAVCCGVLNLLSQVGSDPGNAALALAYRVVFERLKPLKSVLAQNVNAVSRTPQGTNLIP